MLIFKKFYQQNLCPTFDVLRDNSFFDKFIQILSKIHFSFNRKLKKELLLVGAACLMKSFEVTELATLKLIIIDMECLVFSTSSFLSNRNYIKYIYISENLCRNRF